MNGWDNMLKLFTNQEIMIMATVVIGLLIVIFSLSLLDIREKIRNKKKIEVENNIEENNINEIEKEDKSKSGLMYTRRKEDN